MSRAALAAEVVHIQPRQQECDLSLPHPPNSSTIGSVHQEWDPEATAAITNEIRKIGRTIQLDCREEMRKVGRRMQDELRLLWRDLPKGDILGGVPENGAWGNAPGSVGFHPSPIFNVPTDHNDKLRQAAIINGDEQIMDVLDLKVDSVLNQHATSKKQEDTGMMVKNGYTSNQAPVQAWSEPLRQDERQGEGKESCEETGGGAPRSKENRPTYRRQATSIGSLKSQNTEGAQDNARHFKSRVFHTMYSTSEGRKLENLGSCVDLTLDRQVAKDRSNKKRRKAHARVTVQSLTWWQFRHSSLRDVVQSVVFDNIVGLVIMMNAVVIGVQTDYNARNLTDEVPVGYFVFEQFFCVFFSVELVLRIWVYRSAFFNCRKEGFMWNMFDTFVVGAQLLEVFFDLIARSTKIDVRKIRLLRIMRVLRLIRILRVVRVLHLVSELREILASIAGSFRSLVWVVILLGIMLFVVAVYFTQSVTDHLVETSDDANYTLSKDETFLKDYFGSMSRAVLTLWQAMSGGLDWDVLAEPLLQEISFVTGFLFAVFIAFGLLALMNVVTGVFVQTALLSAQREEEAFMTAQIVQLFQVGHKDEVITEDGIEDTLADPETASIWRNVGVQAEDAQYLFKLLDIDGGGQIKFEEFLAGCLRLNGNAKAIDILTVMQEQRRSTIIFAKKLEEVETLITSVLELLGDGLGQFFASPSQDVGHPGGGANDSKIAVVQHQGGNGGNSDASGGGGNMGATETLESTAMCRIVQHRGSYAGNIDHLTRLMRHIQEDVSNLLDQGSESRQDLRSLTRQLLGPLRWLEGLSSCPEPPATLAERDPSKRPDRPGTTWSNGSWV